MGTCSEVGSEATFFSNCPDTAPHFDFLGESFGWNQIGVRRHEPRNQDVMSVGRRLYCVEDRGRTDGCHLSAERINTGQL